MTPKPKIVCECLKVSEAQVLKAIRTKKIRSIKDIIDYTSAGDGCTCCHPLLREYLEREGSVEDATCPRPSAP
ncbi:MAG: (2Fe-2S)-binding protein [Elusimicrobia bacterium]|nr:(2Fe-2S)-binding protein [Elusimicrobiota bacterium]